MGSDDDASQSGDDEISILTPMYQHADAVKTKKDEKNAKLKKKKKSG